MNIYSLYVKSPTPNTDTLSRRKQYTREEGLRREVRGRTSHLYSFPSWLRGPLGCQKIRGARPSVAPRLRMQREKDLFT
ncbi:hypothetical protein CEXT_471961 [Caerostris extrusa]|uniref:Uncharacterized protein n=1 Tax=Caerostris extrusa TaxID=172846 RepID=A0AAV4Y8A5_CAEEX|nr:hypothetical protein CEXT_471961 [Caerostris extrusa]